MRNKQMGDGRRETGAVKSLLLGVTLALISGCNPDAANSNADSMANMQDTTKPAQGMTISEPVSPVPKQTADSIWNGDYIEKYPNGITKKRGYISGGLASGEWLYFYDDGKPWSKGHYHNGVRTGYGVSWYQNGQKSSEGYYNNGKPVGVWSYWSEANHTLMVKDFGGVMPDTTGTH